MILKKIIADLQVQEKAGATVVDVKIILDDTDGCSEQYRCGSALFMLWKFAWENEIDYDRAVDCAGHGKKKIDGYGGWLKNYLKRQMRSKFEYQPENLDVEKRNIVYVDMDEAGNEIGFADTAAELWNNREKSGRMPANNLEKKQLTANTSCPTQKHRSGRNRKQSSRVSKCKQN